MWEQERNVGFGSKSYFKGKILKIECDEKQ